jgi:hypothetical protein
LIFLLFLLLPRACEYENRLRCTIKRRGADPTMLIWELASRSPLQNPQAYRLRPRISCIVRQASMVRGLVLSQSTTLRAHRGSTKGSKALLHRIPAASFDSQGEAIKWLELRPRRSVAGQASHALDSPPLKCFHWYTRRGRNRNCRIDGIERRGQLNGPSWMQRCSRSRCSSSVSF